MASNPSRAPAHLILRDEDPKDLREYVLDPEEVARMIARSPDDVARLARKGRLRARKVGSRWKFCLHDVIAYLRGLSQIDSSI